MSPLQLLLPEHVAPERLYLEARWASLVFYAAAADLLPLASGANATTVRQHVLHVAERLEGELGEERPCFIDGYPAEWADLSIPGGRIVAALDGGYVRNWDDRNSNFELIVAARSRKIGRRTTLAWRMVTIANPSVGCSRC